MDKIERFDKHNPLIHMTVQIDLLTVYDMCKAVDRGMVITDVKVMEKRGGKSGDWMAA